MADRQISVDEISAHHTDTDCWVVIDGVVWDITKFAPEHPGGPGIIYRYAGKDATAAYNEIHSPSIIQTSLPPDARKGVLDSSTITPEWSRQSHPPPSSPKPSTTETHDRPPLESILNLHDFALAAQHTATAKTWAFYTSAANDLITHNLNTSLYPRILFRPRVMRKVQHITTSTPHLLNYPSTFPLFISPAAMARLIHPDGELAIARACQSRGIIQTISNNASFSASEIVSHDPLVAEHPFIFQLYVNRNRTESEKLLERVLAHSNVRGIMVTTDAAAAGKREADERVKADESVKNPMMGTNAKNDKRGGGYGRLMGGFIDPDLNWDDIKWLRKKTGGRRLFLKGVMSADDVMLAVQEGLDGVVLSNHGGRNLDTSPPALVTLLEVHRRFPEIVRDHHPNSVAVREGRRKGFAILVDGGIRRGSDILKCVCLGAVACGVGRPALFATGYGQEGVEAMIDILKDEFEVAMRNNGITSIEECGPEYVNTGDMDALVPKTQGHGYAVDWRGLKAKL